MTLDNVLKVSNLVAWIIVGLVFYFTGQTDTAADVYQVKERVAILEHKVQQEMAGYAILQSSIGLRLDRIERKMDCIIDKRLCN